MPSGLGGGGLDRPAPASSSWIESPAFDLTFFILSPLAGLLLLLATLAGMSTLLAVAAAALLGGPHYLATYSFYFWDDTAAYQRQRWFAYFVIPLLILAAVGLVAWFRLPVIIIVVVYFWNAYHVSRQSCGILSLYRHKAGVSDPRQKSITNAAIICTNFAMAVSNLDWYPALHSFLSEISPRLPSRLWQGAAIAAVVTLARLAVTMVRRCRQGPAITTSEMAFLGTSLLLFHPYLWVRDSNLATLGMLLGHFIQYLGIVWLLHARKFAAGTGSRRQRYLSRLWLDPWILAPSILAGGGLFLILQINIMAVTIALVLLHFYLDALFWAFKRPEVRRAITPYLMGGRRQPAPAINNGSIADVEPAH